MMEPWLVRANVWFFPSEPLNQSLDSHWAEPQGDNLREAGSERGAMLSSPKTAYLSQNMANRLVTLVCVTACIMKGSKRR